MKHLRNEGVLFFPVVHSNILYITTRWIHTINCTIGKVESVRSSIKHLIQQVFLGEKRLIIIFLDFGSRGVEERTDMV